MNVLPACIYLHPACIYWIPWNWNYGWMHTHNHPTIWVLTIESGSSVRARNGAISLATKFLNF